VNLSVTTEALSTWPKGSNHDRSSSSLVLKLKFPTKIFFIVSSLTHGE
jgi:hypothetical protein